MLTVGEEIDEGACSLNRRPHICCSLGGTHLLKRLKRWMVLSHLLCCL